MKTLGFSCFLVSDYDEVLAMKKTVALTLFALVVTGFIACGGADDVNSNADLAAKIARAVAASPDKDLLVGLETKAIEAWKNSDIAFWETHLDQSYISFGGGRRLNRAGEIKMISDGKCEIGNHTFSEVKMVPVGNDAIVLIVKATGERTCGGQKLPNPVITSTLYVRSAETWKAAYHNEVPIIATNETLKARPLNPEAPEKPVLTGADTPQVDSFTEQLFAVENKVWTAWKIADRSAIEQYFTEDLTLVGPAGTVTVGKAAVINALMLPKCDIKSAAPSHGVATQISPVVGILTFRGNATGMCDGRPLANFWGTSIFQKEGDEWKIVFTIETPA